MKLLICYHKYYPAACVAIIQLITPGKMELAILENWNILDPAVYVYSGLLEVVRWILPLQIPLTPLEKSNDLLLIFCMTKYTLYLCIVCYRYVNGHAKDHYEEAQQHSVCMDCDSMVAFW